VNFLTLFLESKNFDFVLPQSVYYAYNFNTNSKSILDSCDDFTSNSLYSWLANLKMEQFFNNFLVAGYHSIDLLYMQMNSKNLLTEKTLEEEFGIKKVGYRIRILNKLLDGKIFNYIYIT